MAMNRFCRSFGLGDNERLAASAGDDRLMRSAEFMMHLQRAQRFSKLNLFLESALSYIINTQPGLGCRAGTAAEAIMPQIQYAELAGLPAGMTIAEVHFFLSRVKRIPTDAIKSMEEFEGTWRIGVSSNEVFQQITGLRKEFAMRSQLPDAESSQEVHKATSTQHPGPGSPDLRRSPVSVECASTAQKVRVRFSQEHVAGTEVCKSESQTQNRFSLHGRKRRGCRGCRGRRTEAVPQQVATPDVKADGKPELLPALDLCDSPLMHPRNSNEPEGVAKHVPMYINLSDLAVSVPVSISKVSQDTEAFRSVIADGCSTFCSLSSCPSLQHASKSLASTPAR